MEKRTFLWGRCRAGVPTEGESCTNRLKLGYVHGMRLMVTWEESARDRERLARAGCVAAPERTRIRDAAKAERLRRIGVPEVMIGPAGIRMDLNGSSTRLSAS